MHRFDAGRQPGGRPPAPGRLAYAQAFCNTFWVDGAEGWPDPAALGSWLRGRGFASARPGEEDLRRSVALREAVRAALRDPAARPALDALSRPVRPRICAGILEPDGDDVEAALALVVAVLAEARLAGTLDRLKVCPHHHCGWVFWDSSRNRSSQWCSMRVCGGRTKAERFRRRRTSVHRPQGPAGVRPNTDR